MCRVNTLTSSMRRLLRRRVALMPGCTRDRQPGATRFFRAGVCIGLLWVRTGVGKSLTGLPNARPRRTGAPADGQRPRNDRLGATRLMPAGWHRHRRHRPGLPLAEPLDRVVQRPGPATNCSTSRSSARLPKSRRPSRTRRRSGRPSRADETRSRGECWLAWRRASVNATG